MASEASAQLSQLFQRALSLIKVERVFEAVPLLNQVIEAEPNWVEPYVHRARVRRRLGDKERAIADYTKAIKLSPTAETYLERALVWLELNQVRGAIADAKQVVVAKPELAGGHRLLGKALGLLGDGESAVAAYKQAARCYLNEKDKENAQKCIDAIGPLKALPAYSLSEQYAHDHAQPLSGKDAAANDALDTIPATPEAFLQRLEAKYEAGEYAAVLKDLNWLINLHPQNVSAIALRGVIQARLGDRTEAVADLALAARLQTENGPDANEVRFRRGQMRLILSDCDGAVEEFSALIAQAQPPEARYFAQRGHSYRLMENAEQAFKDYSNAISLDSENALLYELRADVQKSMQSTEGAIADYQQAATLWLNQGHWQKHQQVVDNVRLLRKQTQLGSGKKSSGGTVSIKSYFRQLPVVEVLFDGIAKFDVVIDRNAPNSIITQSMASQLNLNLVSYRYVYLADGTPMELSIAQLRSVAVGETVVTDVYVAIAPDSATVVLGKDCFSTYSIQISGNEITFARR